MDKPLLCNRSELPKILFIFSAGPCWLKQTQCGLSFRFFRLILIDRSNDQRISTNNWKQQWILTNTNNKIIWKWYFAAEVDQKKFKKSILIFLTNFALVKFSPSKSGRINHRYIQLRFSPSFFQWLKLSAGVLNHYMIWSSQILSRFF